MSELHSKNLVPAVLYLRMSSDQQEISIPQQRSELLPWAEREGYKIVREYVDGGKSGSKDQEKRIEFNRLLLDAQNGDFQAVLCWNTSRFSRMDSIDAGIAVRALRPHGIYLHTLRDGKIDWNTMTGRIMAAIKSEMDNQYSIELSAHSIRGRKAVCQMGYWPNGVVPFGYDKSYTDGVRTIEVKRNEPFKKGRNWHLRLVVNEEEAAVVREIFDRLVNLRHSRYQIANDLTARGVPSPRGQNGASNGAWDVTNLKRILTERGYVGTASVGHGRKNHSAHNRIAPVEQTNACPRIVDDVTWHQAQEILREAYKANRKRALAPDGSKKPAAADASRPRPAQGGTLSGFLVCGHCGYRLAKQNGVHGIYYRCTSASRRTNLGCHNYRAHEGSILPKVCRWLAEEVDAELIAGLQAQPPQTDGRISEEVILAEKVKVLAERVKGATESALLAPPAARETAWGMVKRWQEELDASRGRLALVQAVRNSPELSNFSKWWVQAKSELLVLAGGETYKLTPDDRPEESDGAVFVASGPAGGPAESCTLSLVRRVGENDQQAEDALPSAAILTNPEKIRALLSRLGFRVTLWWEKVANRKGRSSILWRLKDAQIEASVDLGDESSGVGDSCSSRHDPFTPRG